MRRNRSGLAPGTELEARARGRHVSAVQIGQESKERYGQRDSARATRSGVSVAGGDGARFGFEPVTVRSPAASRPCSGAAASSARPARHCGFPGEPLRGVATATIEIRRAHRAKSKKSGAAELRQGPARNHPANRVALRRQAAVSAHCLRKGGPGMNAAGTSGRGARPTGARANRPAPWIKKSIST